MWERSTGGFVKLMKVLLNVIICLLLGIIFPPPRVLKALDPDRPINRYQLDEWGIETGLTSETVEAILQTPDGYLWLGTGEGLFRYDGLTFEEIYFESGESEGAPSINALAQDKEGGIWIGAKGLVHFKNGNLRNYTSEDGFPSYEIRCLAQDSFGSLWIGTFYNALYRLKDNKFAHFDRDSGLGGNEIYSILEDSSGNLWIANADRGLYLGNNGKFVRHEIMGLEGEYSVYKIYEDRRGILWVGTNAGLVGIANPGSIEENTVYLFTPADGLSDNSIWTILEDSHGNLWVGTQNGISRIKHSIDAKFIIEKRMEGMIIKSLFEDREENLWIGTIGAHLKQLRDGTFSTYWKNAGVPYWRISLHQDSNGIIRIGSIVGDLFQFDRLNEMFYRVLRTDNTIESEIYAIEEDRNGDLWLGTVKKGVLRVNSNGDIITRYTTENGLSSNLIRCLLRDSRGWMWIGTISGGVNCYKNGKFETITSREGLAGDMVFDLLEDKNNNIWIGTFNGICCLEKGSFDRESIKTYLTGTFVMDIFEDEREKDLFWIGTNGSGLIRFKNKEITTFTEKDGLANNNVFKILEDQRENLWFGSSDGISRISKREFNDFIHGRTKTLQCTIFGFSDGLQSLECRRGSRNSAIKTHNGELWFGTRKGIAVVNPERVTINKYPPPVVIKKIVVNYESIPIEQSGRSFKGLKDVVFDFTAPTFVSSEKVRLRYKLEGYDQDWRIARYPSTRRAHYQKLIPGDYRFVVTACNSSGVWNKKGASFRFTVTPFFYQTIPFRIFFLMLAFAFVLALYYGLRRYLYLRKLKMKYKNSTLDPQKAENTLKKLLYLLESKKLFKDETLSLNSLSKKLNIAPRYLSQIVNDQLNKNFRDFINNYRVEEAKEMLMNPGNDEFAILEIAYEVGFNSKEVFNRCFKKYTDMTPSEFKKQSVGKKNE